MFELPLATLKAMLLLIATTTGMVAPSDWQPNFKIVDHVGEGCNKVRIFWQAESNGQAEAITTRQAIYLPEGVNLNDPHKYCVVNHELTHGVQFALGHYYKANYIEREAYAVHAACLRQFGTTLEKDTGWTQASLNKMFKQIESYTQRKNCKL